MTAPDGSVPDGSVPDGSVPDGSVPAGSVPDGSVPTGRPYDPERGLRGVMSGTLILEVIVVLLSIPVAKNTGSGTTAAGVIAICVLAAAMVALCAFVSRPWFVAAALTLQAAMILGWLITPSLGVMGIVFALVWALIIWFRNEFRRRLARPDGTAGTLPTPPG